MDSSRLLLCLLWARHLLGSSCATVSFKSSGEAVVVKEPSSSVERPYVPLRSRPEVRVSMPGGWNVSSFTMNVTIVDAHESSMRPHSILESQNNQTHQVTVISSWILFHMPGNHTDSLSGPTLPKLVGGLRDGVADALEVCRSSLGIVDLRAINIDVIDKVDLEEDEDTGASSSDDKDSKSDGPTLLEHAANLMRSMRAQDRDRSHVNVTQIKAVYEVRTFTEMRTSDAEVGRRIDKFQIYSKFSDLNRLLGRSLSQVEGHSFDGVMLDDVGYASRHQLSRPPLSESDLADCAEEVSLHDARQIHQFVMAMSLIMVALITCAGSTIFTIKHASSVPSRMNPLVSVNS